MPSFPSLTFGSGLIAKRIADKDDPHAAMSVSEFLAKAWKLANDKARVRLDSVASPLVDAHFNKRPHAYLNKRPPRTSVPGHTSRRRQRAERLK